MFTSSLPSFDQAYAILLRIKISKPTPFSKKKKEYLAEEPTMNTRFGSTRTSTYLPASSDSQEKALHVVGISLTAKAKASLTVAASIRPLPFVYVANQAKLPIARNTRGCDCFALEALRHTSKQAAALGSARWKLTASRPMTQGQQAAGRATARNAKAPHRILNILNPSLFPIKASTLRTNSSRLFRS